REPRQVRTRRLVRAVLRPHHRVHGQFKVGGFPPELVDHRRQLVVGHSQLPMQGLRAHGSLATPSVASLRPHVIGPDRIDTYMAYNASFRIKQNGGARCRPSRRKARCPTSTRRRSPKAAITRASSATIWKHSTRTSPSAAA